MSRTTPLAIIAILISMLACNMPSSGAPVTDVGFILTQTALAGSPTPGGTATAGPSLTPTATQTIAVTPTNTSPGVPCNLASFVSDVTVPDNTVFDLNENFTKVWRLKNVGSCTWTSGYSVVFDSGDLMGGPASQQLTNGTVGPNQTIDVSVDLKAPGNAGTYKGNWKLREPGGTLFALSTGPFWVQIKTQAEPAAQLPDWPITKQGDSGPVVRALQHLLKQHDEVLDADGIFGPVTKTRLQHFQSVNGLAPDGIAGAQTWPKLIIQRQQGSTGQAVRAIQVLLNDKFGYGIAVDGIFGPSTDDAVRDFQDDHDLAVDGIVGPQTWRMLVGG
jgi:peptidoglycan hydrolase-like protein with peptidoglycan-binding domain